MDFDPSRPIWVQLVDEFTRRIVAGSWSVGERIPGVRELAAELRVNPNTVQRALAELERRALVRTERTAGRFVTGQREAIQASRSDLVAAAARSYAQRAHGLGMSLETAQEFLSRHWPTAGEEVS